MRYDGDVLVLSRRNLQALLAKLDLPDGVSARTIVGGSDAKFLVVRAENDDEHYTDRPAGIMHPREEVGLSRPKTGVMEVT